MQDGTTEGRLAAAALAYQTERFPLQDLEGDSVYRPHMPDDPPQDAGLDRETERRRYAALPFFAF